MHGSVLALVALLHGVDASFEVGVLLADEFGTSDADTDAAEAVVLLQRHDLQHVARPRPRPRDFPESCSAFASYHDGFASLISGCALIAEKDYAFAHEAPVYIPATNSLVWASNRRGSGAEQYVELFTMQLDGGEPELLPERVWKTDIVMANGAVLDYTPGSNLSAATSILITSQGNMERRAGIYRLDLETFDVNVVTDSANEEEDEYNSPNDVTIDPVSGAVLFTDPSYGFWQDFRPQPELGNWLWMYERGLPGATDEVTEPKLLADSFVRPNGLAFASRAGHVLYVTDTGYFRGGDFVSERELEGLRRLASAGESKVEPIDAPVQFKEPRTVYAFEVGRDLGGRITGLHSRRVVLAAGAGVPDGIKVDCHGRLYIGVGNGVAVYTKDGKHLATFHTKGGCANLALVPRGQATDVFALCETQLWRFSVNVPSSCQYRL